MQTTRASRAGHGADAGERIQFRTGGPRGGRGAPVRPAMCAAGRVCSAWASALGGSTARASGEGGVIMGAHKGQSMLAEGWVDLPSSPSMTIFMPPMVLHTIWPATGLTMGE